MHTLTYMKPKTPTKLAIIDKQNVRKVQSALTKYLWQLLWVCFIFTIYCRTRGLPEVWFVYLVPTWRKLAFLCELVSTEDSFWVRNGDLCPCPGSEAWHLLVWTCARSVPAATVSVSSFVHRSCCTWNLMFPWYLPPHYLWAPQPVGYSCLFLLWFFDNLEAFHPAPK